MDHYFQNGKEDYKTLNIISYFQLAVSNLEGQNKKSELVNSDKLTLSTLNFKNQTVQLTGAIEFLSLLSYMNY